MVIGVSVFYFRDWIFGKLTMQTSVVMSNDLLKSVMHKDTMFFTRTPTGQIVNRLVQDVESLDIDFNYVLGYFYRGIFTFLATFVLIIAID